MKKTTIGRKTPKNYLNNKDLLAEVIKSKKQGKMTDKMAIMLQLLCARFGKKGSYCNYSFNDDMQAYAMYMLVKTWDSFDPKKSKNPFAFFTECIYHSFVQYLNLEKKQRDIRDSVLVNNGLMPSNTFVNNYEEDARQHHEDLHIVEDEQDFHYISAQARQLNKTIIDNIQDQEQQDESPKN